MGIKFPLDPVAAPLTPDIFRKQIQNIQSSYHALELDFIAELVQNSLDALEDVYGAAERKVKGRPEIHLSFDHNRHVIRIEDNGPGLPDEILEKFAYPNHTTKETKRRRGHKGVGLAFAIWSTTDFRFATKRSGDKNPIRGKLIAALEWVRGTSAKNPKVESANQFEGDFFEEFETGTVMQFTLDESERVTQLVRRLSDDGICTLLKTATAIGFTNITDAAPDEEKSWLDSLKVSVKVAGRDKVTVTPGFLYPHEKYSSHCQDLGSLPQDVDKMQKLFGKKKCIFKFWSKADVLSVLAGDDYKVLHHLASEQNVRAYGAFLDKASTFKDWNGSLFLKGEGTGRFRKIVQSGIHFASATMPVGEVTSVDLSYGSGNKDRAFILIQFDDIRPDVGRKTFERNVTDLAQRIAEQMVHNMVANRALLIPSDTPHGETESEQQMSLKAVIDAAVSREVLSAGELGICTIPVNEQEVVALFHALLGKGYLRGYRILSVFGSSKKYDGVFEYCVEKSSVKDLNKQIGLAESAFGKKGKIEFPPSILEFKTHLSDLVVDFQEQTKCLGEIRLAVAWDDGDLQAFGGASDYRLEEIDHTSAEKQFVGETHLLKSTHGGQKVHVIILRDFIEALKLR